LAQNRPLWRMMSTYSATQSYRVACIARNDDDDDDFTSTRSTGFLSEYNSVYSRTTTT